jgi:plasmid stability protein
MPLYTNSEFVALRYRAFQPDVLQFNWSCLMPVTLSIENAPDDVVERLRRRANRNHRSLQGELLAIIEGAAREDQFVTPAEMLALVRRLELQTPSEAAALIRADRDAR